MLPPGDTRLIQIVDAALADTARRSGEWLVCKPGCTQCCTGVFAIHPLDAERLRQGLRELAIRQPERAEALRRRAQLSVERLRDDFPGDPASGMLGESEEAQEQFTDFANEEICPALDDGRQWTACGVQRLRIRGSSGHHVLKPLRAVRRSIPHPVA